MIAAETSPTQGRGARMGPRDIAAAALLLGLAIAVSSVRLVAVPGVEFYLGPLFYLAAYRMAGLRLAIPVAIAVMAPTVGWWGHPFSIAISVAHLLFIHALRNRVSGLFQATAMFYLTVGGVLNWVVMLYLHHPSLIVGTLTFTRKLLNDLLLAGIVDLLCAFLVLELAPVRVLRRRTVSLRILMVSGTTLSLVGAITAIFIAEVRQFRPTFADYQQATVLRAELYWLQSLQKGRTLDGLVTLPTGAGASEPVYLAAKAPGARQATVMQALGCSVIDDGGTIEGADDRNTFTFWLKACQSRRIDSGSGTAYLVYSTRVKAEQSYRTVVLKLVDLLPVLLATLSLQLYMLRSLGKSLKVWSEVVTRFGTPDLDAPATVTLREFIAPVSDFVDANNSYVALVTERRRLGEALTDLSRGIDLRLLSDVRFDEVTGRLSFVQVDLDAGSVPRSFAVHPGDRLALASASRDSQAILELRIPSTGSDDWHLLMARVLLEPGHWQSGCIIRLHQPKVTQDRMMHQARLVELGGMASALSHELKQPLFTIALAAENGSYSICDDDRPGSAKALAKFSRIVEQVERARTIIGRISRYARVDSAPDEKFDLIDGVRSATTFMRPLLIQENVQVKVVDAMDGQVDVCMPRVGLEQIIVNAMQNAVDSIGTRRLSEASWRPGEIVIRCDRTSDGVTIAIADNGAGLGIAAPETLFEAFVTTKSAEKGTGLGLYISRQIMMESGGTIELTSRPGPETGAVLTIRLNALVLVGPRVDAA